MSSIKDSQKNIEDIIDQLYHQKFVPAAERFRQRGIHFFSLRPDPSCSSYFSENPSKEPNYISEDSTDFVQLLEERFNRQKLPELAELVTPLLELADLLMEEETSSEVSPFIYVMF